MIYVMGPFHGTRFESTITPSKPGVPMSVVLGAGFEPASPGAPYEPYPVALAAELPAQCQRLDEDTTTRVVAQAYSATSI
jgi:hypothetical protein